MGAMLTAWTIRISLACLVAAVALRITGARHPATQRLDRRLWTFGFLAFLAHVVSAFHFHHGWSNAAAVADTQRQTRELLGFEFGGGIYFNYAFIAAWLIDLIWTLRNSEAQSKGVQIVRSSCLLFMLFIAFNGTVVFKSGWLRASGIAATVGLLSLLVAKRFCKQESGIDSICSRSTSLE